MSQDPLQADSTIAAVASSNSHETIPALEATSKRYISRRGATIASIIVGLVLILAGGLKASNAIAYIVNFRITLGASSLWGSLIIAGVEIVLGVFLLRHSTSFRVWLLTTLLFGGFFFSNIIAVDQGKVSCDCFGVVISRPYKVAILDFLVLGICFFLLVFRKEPIPSPEFCNC